MAPGVVAMVVSLAGHCSVAASVPPSLGHWRDRTESVTPLS